MGIDDTSFSKQLRLHASSLDLKQIGPVGAWEFGQSIRRALGHTFFYDLSLDHFYPLGLHHPATLRVAAHEDNPQSFGKDLIEALPHLRDFKWAVLSQSRYQDFLKNNNTLVKANASLDSVWGWSVLEQNNYQHFSVKLADQTYFLSSIDEIPSSDTFVHHRWLRLFFSTKVLGPNGRLKVVSEQLRKCFNLSQLNGLSFNLPLPLNQLSSQGIKAEHFSSHEVTLHFPISVLISDIENVEQIVKSQRISLC